LAHARSFIPTFGNDKLRRLHRILDAFGKKSSAERMASLLTMDTGDRSFKCILSKDWQAEIDKYDPFKRYKKIAERLAGLDEVQKMLYCDVSIKLPDGFLEKVDRATMAFGIESRVPFLDNDLSSYAMDLPSRLKVHGNNKKFLLKKALQGIVPDKILNGPKTGFGVPYGHWLATSLYEYTYDIFEDMTSRPYSFFDKSKLLLMLKKHKDSPSQQTGFILWKALNLSLWLRFYFNY